MRLVLILIFGTLVYLVGYNSGSNNGYAIALKVDPQCKPTTIYIVFEE